jgi:hypothetical protein
MLTKNLFITTALQVGSTDSLKITKNTTFRTEADFGLPPFLPEDDVDCDNDHQNVDDDDDDDDDNNNNNNRQLSQMSEPQKHHLIMFLI